MPSEAGSPSSGCRATHRNSIRSSTSGVIGSITLYPTSARTISLSSATRPAEPYAACADVPPSSDPPGIKLNCHYNMQDSIGLVWPLSSKQLGRARLPFLSSVLTSVWAAFCGAEEERMQAQLSDKKM